MYKIGHPISRIDFYRLAPLGLEAMYNGSSDVKIYSTKTKGMRIRIRGDVIDFEFYRNNIESDLDEGKFLISKLPYYTLLKRKSNV